MATNVPSHSSARHSRRNALHALEERPDEVDVEVAKCHSVRKGRDQHVSLENRRAIEKTDRDVIAKNLAHVHRSVDGITENALSLDHERILPSRHDDAMDIPRIAPITTPSPEVTELYDKARLRAPNGSPLNIFGTLAHHPDLLRRWLVFGAHVLAKNSLSARELLIRGRLKVPIPMVQARCDRCAPEAPTRWRTRPT
jgi:hypothetical protein